MEKNIYQLDPQIYDDYIFTEIEKNNFEKVFELVKDIASRKDCVNILDFCCGTGILPRKWLFKLKNITYLGVDINDGFIRFARAKTKDARIQYVVGDSINFKANKKFNIILATSSYHHIDDRNKRRFLKNVTGHLEPGGTFIVYEKILQSSSNKIDEVENGTKFYLERIKYMLKTEKLSKNQLFALFNEQYLTSIRKEEYKVDFQYFKEDIESCGMKIEKQIKLWPAEDIFHNDKVGDFIFLIGKV